ncbi:MAG: hypothetical protein PHX93_00105 [Candidatus Peribacteraceae bacterium]|jgi:hypothetical protein|nr:hypothetical protein [Candidatus Peribacteraceae bacterium]
MGTHDDEDVWASYSQQERLTRADPRKDALKREVERKQGRNILDKDAQKLKELKTKVNLGELQSQVSGQQDEESQRSRRAEEDRKHQTFHTETIKEKEEEAVDTAKTKPTAERLIKKEEDEREEQSQAGQEYQQQVG